MSLPSEPLPTDSMPPHVAAAPVRSITHEVQLADGRTLCLAQRGPRWRAPVVYLHGFLGSRLEPLAAGPLDLHLIAVDRPGYGRSDPCPAPSLRRFGHDLAAALDRLAIGQVSLIGVSAGAPYAVAAASVLGRRVERCVLAAGVAGCAAVSSHGGAVASLDRARRNLPRLRRLMPAVARLARRLGLDRALFDLAFVATERFAPWVDAAEVERRLVASTREGTRRGLAGAFADIELLTRPWDIETRAVTAAVTVLHGTDDPIVPPAHAAWYARALPAARIGVVPGARHASLLVNHVAMVLRALGAGPPANARGLRAAGGHRAAAGTRHRV